MADCCNGFSNVDCDPGCDDGAWSTWLRWLVLGLIILAAILIFFAFSFISARRRRGMGNTPHRGTGWAIGRTPPGHAPATYSARPHYQQPYYNNSNNPAPPPYTPPPNSGYYGHNDVELQQPSATYGGYHSGEVPQYKAPDGPPPAHTQ